MICRKHITVFGLVQGVGYRPFVVTIADELGISGTVCNSGGIVKISAVGDAGDLDEFIFRLKNEVPRGGRVDEVIVEDQEISDEKISTRVADDNSNINNNLSENVEKKFIITDSKSGNDEVRFLPADIATCRECERELLEQDNRRYRYPFISCVSCGPRYTIIKDIPYDRERTSMSEFKLCPECEKDYIEPGNIRRHAQTIACENCGPIVKFISSSDEFFSGDEGILKTIELLKDGKIVAIKGIGGYHLCFDAKCEPAALRLREYKKRETKPFAVMFRDTDEIEEYAFISEIELKILNSEARPIVLLDRKKEGDKLALSVCSHSNRIGAMFPCNPIQLLLLREISPLVMTSANTNGEPIITDDAVMLEELKSGYIDAVLSYNREIVQGLDDSIYQVVGDRTQIIRRARGLVPEPIQINRSFQHDVFAAGGDLKSVFAFGRKNMAYLSGHFGDLQSYRAQEKRRDAIEHMSRLLGIRTDDIRTVTDMHPGYFSVRNISKDVKSKVESVNIQHHHAHIASVIAEHGLSGKVLGLAFDGTGYGTDGHIWGSEFLLCEGKEFQRKGHFSEVKTIGGDVSTDALTTLFAFIYEADRLGLVDDDLSADIFNNLESKGLEDSNQIDRKQEINKYKLLKSALDSNVNVVYSSSMGRLFDAVSAALDICYENSYEGECPERLQIEAEKFVLGNTEADCDKHSKINTDLTSNLMDYLELLSDDVNSVEDLIDVQDGVWIADSVRLVVELLNAYMKNKYDRSRLAYIFHKMIAGISVEIADRIAKENNIKQVALGGGTMYNKLLVTDIISGLEDRGYEVYMNEKVPCGDGGIALGQLYLS